MDTTRYQAATAEMVLKVRRAWQVSLDQARKGRGRYPWITWYKGRGGYPWITWYERRNGTKWNKRGSQELETICVEER